MNTTTINQQHDTDFAASAREQAQAHKDQLKAKEAERQTTKARINALTAQRDALNALPPEGDELLQSLNAQLSRQRDKFINELRAATSRGAQPVVNFGNPLAIAALMYDELKANLPDLCRELVGRGGVSAEQRARELHAINVEILQLRAKLNQLGG